MTLPQGWVATTVGDTSRAIGYGLTCTSSIGGEGYRYVRITDIQDRRIDWDAVPFADATIDKATPYRIAKGDLLFARTGATVGKSYLIKNTEIAAVFASYLIRVQCDDEVISPEFAAWYFHSPQYWAQIYKGAGGTGQPNFNGSKLSALRLDLPPTAEQRRIVAELDALTARLARTRTELDRVPVLAAHLRSAATALAVSPASARMVRFGDVLDYKGGSQPPKSTFHHEMAEGRIRLLQIRDFASDSKAVFITDNGKWPRCAPEDVMIGRYGASVGKILTGKGGAYNVALVKMVFDRSRIDARFLFHWLTADTFQGRLREISRSAQDGFNKEDLFDLPFPLLPLEVQQACARKADALVARADRLEAEAARARTLIDRLESAILSKAFRGELVPQDPTDEPANVLLDRIRTQRATAPKPKRGRRGAVSA